MQKLCSRQLAGQYCVDKLVEMRWPQRGVIDFMDHFRLQKSADT
jgi:hypothetical protein